MIITSIPQMFKDFFCTITKNVVKDEDSWLCEYIWRFVLTLACLEGRASLTKISACTGHWRTRQSIVNFLIADWDERGTLLKAAMATLKQLGWQEGDPLYLALDDTQVQKRASVMEGVSKMFLHAEKRYAHGHDVVLASIVYRGVAIPYALRLWTSEEKCKELNESGQPIIFQKITELAADCVRSFFADVSRKVTVLFDSYSLCKAVIDACNDKNFFYLGVVKSNRVIKETKDSKKGNQVGVYSSGYLANKGRSYNVAGSTVKHKIAGLVCYLRKVGTVKVVFCRRKGDNQIITLATNDLECGVKRVVEIYRNRWQIEVLFKSAKQKLGMGDYQFLKRRAVDKYLHLVMISHLFLPHLACKELNEKSSENATKPICLAGISKTKEYLRNILLLNEINQIKPDSRSNVAVRVTEEIKEKIGVLLTKKDDYTNLKDNISC